MPSPNPNNTLPFVLCSLFLLLVIVRYPLIYLPQYFTLLIHFLNSSFFSTLFYTILTSFSLTHTPMFSHPSSNASTTFPAAWLAATHITRLFTLFYSSYDGSTPTAPTPGPRKVTETIKHETRKARAPSPRTLPLPLAYLQSATLLSDDACMWLRN